MRIKRFHARRWAAVAAAAALGLTGVLTGAGAADASSGYYNHASARTSGWHRDSFDVAFQVRQTYSNVINAYNSADASSKNCTDCRGVAIAFQIVTDARTPKVVNAGNSADSTIVNCTDCDTVAVAYQFVVAKPTMLSWSDQAKLWRIDWELQSLRWSGDSGPAIAAQVAGLANETASVLANAGHGHWPMVHRYITFHQHH